MLKIKVPSFDSVFLLGVVIFILFCALGGIVSLVRGNEPPPIILPMPQVKAPPRDQPLVAPATTPWVAPPDGPMCLPDSEIQPPTPTLFGLLVSDLPSDQERADVYNAVDRCWRFQSIKNPWEKGKPLQDPPDPWKLLALLRYEADLGVPPPARGILLAAWCWEASYRNAPRAGDIGASHGPFQMQDWMWAWCGHSTWTYDPLVAANCYWSRVDRYLGDGRCPGNWVRAEAMTANGKRYGAVARGQAQAFARYPEKAAKAYCAVKSRHAEEYFRWLRLASPGAVR